MTQKKAKTCRLTSRQRAFLASTTNMEKCRPFPMRGADAEVCQSLVALGFVQGIVGYVFPTEEGREVLADGGRYVRLPMPEEESAQ